VAPIRCRATIAAKDFVLFRKRWEFGRARIVARQRHKRTPGVHTVNKYATKYDYVADVVPDSGLAPFRATFTSTFGSDEILLAPNIGSQTRVRFKAGGEDVRLDGKFLVAQERARKDAEREQFNAAANASPGTLPASPADLPPISAGNLPRTATGSSGQSTVRVTTTTNPADVPHMRDNLQQMRDRIERLAAEHPGSVVRFGVAACGSAGSDPLDRLQRLADLHDRGVITDAEFTAEKAKILRET